MTRPTAITLGAHRVPIRWHADTIDGERGEVVEDTSNTASFGLYSPYSPTTIHVSERSPDMAECLLHEALHHAARQTGVHSLLGTIENEVAVTALAVAVVELLRRNKDLAAWLVKPE